MEKGNSNICSGCGKQDHYQNQCTSQSNGRNFWRGSRGQQAREGVRYQQYQQQQDHGYSSTADGNYYTRGRGLRDRADQQRQDRSETKIFTAVVEVSEENN